MFIFVLKGLPYSFQIGSSLNKFQAVCFYTLVLLSFRIWKRGDHIYYVLMSKIDEMREEVLCFENGQIIKNVLAILPPLLEKR